MFFYLNEDGLSSVILGLVWVFLVIGPNEKAANGGFFNMFAGASLFGRGLRGGLGWSIATTSVASATTTTTTTTAAAAGWIALVWPSSLFVALVLGVLGILVGRAGTGILSAGNEIVAAIAVDLIARRETNLQFDDFIPLRIRTFPFRN